ncbi:MAG: 23S rRNA (adenine(1618)-N(6))-methyltransferase RlmF [Saprospiraceae bacterium]
MKSRKNETGVSPMHPRNKHRNRYDFKALINTLPELHAFIQLNKYGIESIDFFDPAAVKALNKALLLHYYGLSYWDIPQGYLCPPVPGRADYIHYMADLLGEYNNGKIPTGIKISAMDIGIGANAIYPIIGIQEYGWHFIGTEVNGPSLESAQKIIEHNPTLQKKLILRKQNNPDQIFKGMLQNDEFIDVVVCNPPFHDSKQVAKEGSVRKLKNLKSPDQEKSVLNFGGQDTELWRKGGELKFALDMIKESQQLSTSFFLCSIFISKEIHLKPIYAALVNAKALDIQIVIMGQGQKTSRIVVWTYLNPSQIEEWKNSKK